MTRIQLSHGGGGEETNKLISDLFYKYFKNDILIQAEDAALLDIDGKIAFTTDSFTVSPLFFNGGDIGKLSIAGTVNDLAMMGAKPLYLSSAFMIEEGFPFSDLETIVKSMRDELTKSGAKIVCGDTKVVPKGSLDQIFINTTGIGTLQTKGISAHNLGKDDAIIISRDFGRHGATILSVREGMELESDLASDCETLWPAVDALIKSDIDVKALRDATRGGLAAVLNEWAEASAVCIEIEEDKLPICDEVKGICEILGFEPYDFANEGTFVIAVASDDVGKTLDVLKAFNFTSSAAYIGKVSNEKPKKVILHSAWGSRRYLELPKGELLPRIC